MAFLLILPAPVDGWLLRPRHLVGLLVLQCVLGSVVPLSAGVCSILLIAIILILGVVSGSLGCIGRLVFADLALELDHVGLAGVLRSLHTVGVLLVDLFQIDVMMLVLGAMHCVLIVLRLMTLTLGSLII